MKKHDDIWLLIKEGSPLPEPPAWLAARTLSRLRLEQSSARGWNLLPSWVWAGSCGLVAILLVTGWEVRQHIVHEQQVTFAALDILSGSVQPQNQEDAWFSTY